MKIRHMIGISISAVALAGCASLNEWMCAPNCRAVAHNSSSLVQFLYAAGQLPPAQDSVPELRLPLRVGLAFLPSHTAGPIDGPDAVQKEAILERVRQRFADRKFVADIVVIPDYYLATNNGYEGLAGVQRLYNIDVMALVSYDQVTHLDDNKLSLGYITIVGAYVLKGSSHDTTTLVDLAVVDPATRSLILRAGGTDTRHGSSTLIDQHRDARAETAAGFDAAGTQMIDHFDAALTRFEAQVREGKANVRIVKTDAAGHRTGGGALDGFELSGLALMAIVGGLARAGTRPAA